MVQLQLGCEQVLVIGSLLHCFLSGDGGAVARSATDGAKCATTCVSHAPGDGVTDVTARSGCEEQREACSHDQAEAECSHRSSDSLRAAQTLPDVYDPQDVPGR